MDFLANSTALNLRVCNEHPYLALPEQCMVCAELATWGMNQGSDMAGTANIAVSVFPDLVDDFMQSQPHEMTPKDFAALAYTTGASDRIDQTDISDKSFPVDPLAVPELEMNVPYWFDQTDISDTSFPVDPLAAAELNMNTPNWFDQTDISNTSVPADPLAVPELDMNVPYWFDQTDISDTSFPADPLAAPDFDMMGLQPVADWINDPTVFAEGSPLPFVVENLSKEFQQEQHFSFAPVPCSHTQDPIEDGNGHHCPEQLAYSSALQSKSPKPKDIWEETTESEDIASHCSAEHTSCDICMGFHSEGNKLIFCQGCEITVHQECYFVTDIPHGGWFCGACQPRDSLSEESAHPATEDEHGVMNDEENEASAA